MALRAQMAPVFEGRLKTFPLHDKAQLVEQHRLCEHNCPCPWTLLAAFALHDKARLVGQHRKLHQRWQLLRWLEA